MKKTVNNKPSIKKKKKEGPMIECKLYWHSFLKFIIHFITTTFYKYCILQTMSLYSIIGQRDSLKIKII